MSFAKVDIYSAGIIMFELFALIKTGSEKIMVLPELREKGPPDSWEGDHELYAQMTALESSQRPSAAEILVTFVPVLTNLFSRVVLTNLANEKFAHKLRHLCVQEYIDKHHRLTV